MIKKYSSKGINQHTTWVYSGNGKHAGIDKNHDVYMNLSDSTPGAFNCFEINDIEQYSHGEGIDTIWYPTHAAAHKIIEGYLKGDISHIPRK